MAIQQTFPGVYTQVIDQSFVSQSASRFQAGLLGVAEKGAFDTAVSVPSLSSFIQNFGQSVAGSALANVVATLTGITDGVTVVRVGRQYTNLVTGTASGSASAFSIVTPSASLFSAGDYARITQRGKASTINAKVDSVSGSTIFFVSTGSSAVELADTYTSADIDQSPVANAANEAESFLYALAYSPTPLDDGSGTLTLDGDKSAYQFVVSGGTASLAISAGDLLKITQTGKVSTLEVRVKEVRANGTVLLETSNNTEAGYQALALQDSYTSTGATPARLYKALVNTPPVGNPSYVSYQSSKSVQIVANSAGTWANSGSNTGLSVAVAPGSTPGTKKFLVYLNSGLVETIDNLTFSDSTDTNFAETRINGNSGYINVVVLFSTEPSNTINGWNTSTYDTLNVTSFAGGYNGENASVSDFIGTINPATDAATGLKVFENLDSVELNVLAIPGKSDVAIGQELVRVAKAVNAFAVFDVPQSLNGREAIDWHNGAGLYTGQGRINSSYIGLYWNWIRTTDVFTGNLVWVPPTFGALRAMAYTFTANKPWYAAAGDTNGRIPEALTVEYPALSKDTKNAMYGNGNSVNPIIVTRGNIEVYGDRTMQVAESKLSAAHSMVLVNYIVQGLAKIGQGFVFDPNDQVLLSQINIQFTAFLESIKTERGIEGYSLVCDTTNNTATTRNDRNVIVDLYVIPVDTMERLFINATVKESGATLVGVA